VATSPRRRHLGARTSRRSRAEDREIEKLTKKNQRLEDELERTRTGTRHRGKSTRALGEALQERGQRVVVDEILDSVHDVLIKLVGVKRSCALLGRVRSSFYRRRRPRFPRRRWCTEPPNALSQPERTAVLRLLNEPGTVTRGRSGLRAHLGRGIYLCSPATMHRLLAKNGASSDRRAQRTHPARKRPELLATQPNEIWSWI